jgi:hypothetical protein
MVFRKGGEKQYLTLSYSLTSPPYVVTLAEMTTENYKLKLSPECV